MIKKAKKQVLAGESMVETFKMQAGTIPNELKNSLVNDLMTPFPTDILKQFGRRTPRKQTELRPNFNQSGEMIVPKPEALTPDQELILFSNGRHQKEQEMAEKERSNSRRVQILIAELHKIEAEKEQMVAEIEEIKEVATESAKVYHIETSLNVQQTPKASVGKYLIHFITRLFNEIRHKGEAGTDWMTAGVVRAQGKSPRGLEYFWKKDANKQGVTEHGTMMIQG